MLIVDKEHTHTHGEHPTLIVKKHLHQTVNSSHLHVLPRGIDLWYAKKAKKGLILDGHRCPHVVFLVKGPWVSMVTTCELSYSGLDV